MLKTVNGIKGELIFLFTGLQAETYIYPMTLSERGRKKNEIRNNYYKLEWKKFAYFYSLPDRLRCGGEKKRRKNTINGFSFRII